MAAKATPSAILSREQGANPRGIRAGVSDRERCTVAGENASIHRVSRTGAIRAQSGRRWRSSADANPIRRRSDCEALLATWKEIVTIIDPQSAARKMSLYHVHVHPDPTYDDEDDQEHLFALVYIQIAGTPKSLSIACASSQDSPNIPAALRSLDMARPNGVGGGFHSYIMRSRLGISADFRADACSL